MKKTGTYAAIMERIFESKYRRGMREVDFEREDIVRCASELKIALPKNSVISYTVSAIARPCPKRFRKALAEDTLGLSEVSAVPNTALCWFRR